MNYILLLTITLLLNNIPMLFRGYSDSVYNLVYDVGQYSLFTFLLAFIFSITPREKFKERGISIVLMLMFINLTMNTIYDKLDISFFYIQYPLGLLSFSYFIYTTINWKENIEINEIEKDKTYFVFKRPKRFLDFLITLFKVPVSSFSIVNKGEWYLYTKDVRGLYKIDADFLDHKYYNIVEVATIEKSILDGLLGRSWNLQKSNCVTVFVPAFTHMRIKLKRFDFIPAIFAYKFFKGKYDI